MARPITGLRQTRVMKTLLAERLPAGQSRAEAALAGGGPAVGGTISIQVDLTAVPEPPTLNHAISAGETWYFQCWYRDQNPTPTSNFADGIAVTFN